MIVYNGYKHHYGGVCRVDRNMYLKLVEYSMRPEVQERAIVYLAEHLGKFLNPGEHVVLAFREHKPGNISWLMEQAALRIKAIPVIWGPDRHWNTLLMQTFLCHASAVIGPPMVILGLMKLKRYKNTPLPIRKVVTAGYPCPQWMIDGIVKGLDCEVGGCFSIVESGVVAGFACGHSWGVHLREEVYGIDIVDEEGNLLPEGSVGQMVLYPKAAPELRYPTGEDARLVTEPCECGSSSPRLLELQPGKNEDQDLEEFRQYLQSWTSVLDSRVERGGNGLEVEIVCFAGEKLPKLPPAAMRIVRPWNPKHDEPFWYSPTLKNAEK